MSNNFIRVLRNTELCANHEAAIEKLQGKLANLQDGEICIASYGANWGEAKTILGVVRHKTIDNVVKHSYTIFDNEANSAEIAAEIAKLGADKEGISADGKVKVKVVEADGKLTSVTVTTADIASAALLGTTADTSAQATAFGYIKKEAEDRDNAITGAIEALDSTVAATAKDGEQYSVLTGVTQTNGKLASVDEVKLAAVAKTGLASDVATTAIVGNDEHVAVAGTNVSDQITSIATTLKGISTAQSNAFKYITVKLTPQEVSALPGDTSNVKEAYKVVAYIGNTYENATTKETVGDIIKIYKDATIHKIYLGNTGDTINKTTGEIIPQTTPKPSEKTSSLNYAYIKADGTYEIVSIPVGNFLRESEFKNGLDVNENGEVSVKVAEGSEAFLTVDDKGVKLSGVQNAINTAIEGLNANVTSHNNSNVSVNVVETNGKITDVNVTTTGLALDNAVVKNVTVNNVNADVTGNKATVTIDGADIAVADSYETTVYSAPFEGKVGTNHIATGDTVAAAFKKTENTISVLADEVIANEKVTTTAVSKLAESTGVTNTDGVIKYTPKTNANYINGATSVHDATVKLDAAIKTVETKALTSVAGSEAITVSGGKTVSLKLDNTKDGNGDGTTPKPAGANALTINTDGLYLSNVWDCGTY